MRATTIDAFLDGKVQIEQPAKGYRAGADPVLMAACVEVGEGASVLELGCGVGTALCCLGWRAAGLDLAGLEIDASMAALARGNMARNGLSAEITCGDVGDVPPEMRAKRFDAVMLNPPFFDRRHGSGAQDQGREAGRGERVELAAWIKAASRRLAPRGQFLMIHRVERLPEALFEVSARLGDIRLLPLAGKAGKDAERFILTARKGAKGAMQLAAPLVLHDADGRDTSFARAILRDGASLSAARALTIE